MRGPAATRAVMQSRIDLAVQLSKNIFKSVRTVTVFLALVSLRSMHLVLFSLRPSSFSRITKLYLLPRRDQMGQVLFDTAQLP